MKKPARRKAPEQRLDIFPHIFPKAYFDRMMKIAETNPGLAAAIKRWMHVPVLWDLDRRIKMMKRWPGYQQVLTLSMPAVEFLGDENQTPELARLANDGMAEIVAQHPELFPCFVASLPMNNVAASLEEMDRAIGKLGAKGIQIFTNVNGRPLDEPEFYPIFERMSKKYDLPIWVHPSRTAKWPDYPTEQKSKYEIWWLFGWPYETSAFMARLVFSQMFEKLPKLKIITHHLGATRSISQHWWTRAAPNRWRRWPRSAASPRSTSMQQHRCTPSRGASTITARAAASSARLPRCAALQWAR